MTIAELQRNVAAAKSRFNSDIEKLLQKEQTEILDAQKEQWQEGKSATGKDLEPSYLDDPYFKTKAAAQKYAAWKQQITPNPKRKFKSPNLFINGTFYKSVDVAISGVTAIFDSGIQLGKKIEAKYNDLYGLTPENKLEIRNKVIIDYIKLLKNILNL